jgi:hypothetical protein
MSVLRTVTARTSETNRDTAEDAGPLAANGAQYSTKTQRVHSRNAVEQPIHGVGFLEQRICSGGFWTTMLARRHLPTTIEIVADPCD